MAEAIWNDRYILSNMTSEKLYAKSPLTTGVSGTSAYIGLEPSATYNETVLWSGKSYSAQLSESVKNFEKIEVQYGPNGYYNSPIATFYTDVFSANDNLRGVHLEFIEHNGANVYCFPKVQTYKWDSSFTTMSDGGGIQYRVSGNGIQSEATGSMLYLYKVIGINRKEV